MRAVSFARYGSAEALEIVERERPRPGPGDCLVRVHAASVNPLDHRVRAGALRLVLRVKLPFVPGWDCCGEVVETGAAVTRFRPGDVVYAFVPYRYGGCHAEYAALPAATCAIKPASLDSTASSAIPLAGLTALQVIDDMARLGPGQGALVIGASGGVGHFAVQIAKARGARVTGVCGTDHVELVGRLGADRVVDYRREDFRATDERYDLIFDAVAKHSYGACARLLTRRGHYANTLGTLGLFLRIVTLPLYSRRRAHAVIVRPDGEGLARLATLVDEGRLRPEIERTYALDEIRAAHEHSAGGHVGGKLVVRVA